MMIFEFEKSVPLAVDVEIRNFTAHSNQRRQLHLKNAADKAIDLTDRAYRWWLSGGSRRFAVCYREIGLSRID